ncbi:MAG: hypothetical protein ACHQT8_04620 [Chlamydiales bacterium]
MNSLTFNNPSDIATTILEYVDFSTPEEGSPEHVELINQVKSRTLIFNDGKFSSTSPHFIHLERMDRVRALINRFVLAREVGAFELIDEATKTKLQIKVTRTVLRNLQEQYHAWRDQDPFVTLLGGVELEIYTRLPSGQLWSPSFRREESFDDLPSLAMAKKASGVIDLIELTPNDENYPLATKLMQVTAEVSQENGFDIQIGACSLPNPPFFKQLCMTTLDSHYVLPGQSSMIMEPRGEEFYKKQIAERPILYSNIDALTKVIITNLDWCPSGVSRIVANYTFEPTSAGKDEREAWFKQRCR